MSDGYAYLGAGESGKLKFPDEHAEWTRIYAEQGYARIAADSAAKAEKKAERERSKLEAREARAGRKSSVTKDEGLSESQSESQAGDGKLLDAGKRHTWVLTKKQVRASRKTPRRASLGFGKGVRRMRRRALYAET